MAENYSFYNLCSWSNEHEIVAPMAPAYTISPLRKILKGKFGGLTRVNFTGKHDGAYQEVEDQEKRYPTTGYDTLIYKAIYNNAITLLFFVDRGTSIEPIAEMTKFTGEDSRVNIIDAERDKKYFQTLSEEEFFIMFERANSFIKINQKNETRQPIVEVSI
jgi:hypothetical protein